MYNVLIVDDNRFAIEAIRTTMDWPALNVENVLFAYNINKAKNIFNDNRIDLVLCDIEMPGGTGLELASWIRTYYSDTIIIFLTCHADFIYAREALRYGAYDYILKPASIETLAHSIYNAFNADNREHSHQKYSEKVHEQISVSQKVLNYIHNNLHKNLTRESVARHVFLSPDYLAKLIKRETGMSLMTYITKERIEKSKDYLMSTEFSISEIASKVGISNPSHFIQIFKKETGYTPLSFKKSSEKPDTKKP